jgi:WD40 repeat protein/serine/threonine protein kinase
MFANLSGQVLKTYEIQERIGAGGFGAVYRAAQPSIGREVAVKIILPEYANQGDFIRRFETEAQLVARLEHPHVTPLYDYWRDPSGAYLVMRYLRGGSLRDSLEQSGAWSAAKVAQMLNQVGSALAFAHANGVIHRDIKTDNILIDEGGNTYLSDFGIAKDLGGKEHHTGDAILGTPAYLSPEQIRGDLASIQSDVYALGILVFEALTAHKPFYDITPATVLFRQLNEPLPDLAEFRKDLPEDLDPILQRATSKDPSLRYDNALAFAHAFMTVVRDTEPGTPAIGLGTLNVKSITQQEEEIFQAKNPYKGLRAFQVADSADFFGRDSLVEQLLERIANTGNDSDFLAVVGPSGSGKSSVVKAGMLPKIREAALDKEIIWYTAEMVPGTHPMEELEAALLGIATTAMPGLMDQLRQDERGLVRAIKRIIPENSEFVLFIDQFEEAFTLIADEDERIHFLNTILNAVEDERSRIKIIVTLRADFYDRPLLYAQFGNLIRKHTELVLPLNDKELEAAIVGPAERIGLVLDAGLVNAIIADVFAQPGALPLLQYALTELFERRDGRKMTLKSYRDIGGTTGALARRAEELYNNFGAEEQSAARQMFLRLVNLGEGTDDTRRRVFQSDLLSIGSQGAMRKVIEQFGKYRLLTFDNDPQTRASTVEVAHEALIRQWQRVRSWLDENREALRLHRRLTQGAEEWHQSRRDPSFLAQGIRLQQFEEFQSSSDIALTQAEKEFLEVSIHAREDREKIEAERQAREQALERQSAQRLRLLAAVMGIAAIVAAGLAYFAIQAQFRAEEQTLIARNNAATATVAQGQALIEADRAATSEAIALDSADQSRSLALSSNARNAAASGDSQLALALVLQSEEIYAPALPEVFRSLSSFAYAPGPRFRYEGHEASVIGASFSADGSLAVSASSDSSVRVWDNATGQQIALFTIEGLWFNDAVLSPDNELAIGAASDGNLYVWNLASGALEKTLTGHSAEILSLAISTDGSRLLSAGLDRTARIWDLASGRELQAFEHPGAVLKAVFSPDASRVFTATADETTTTRGDDVLDRMIRLWDAETGDMLWEVNPASGFVRAAAYSPLGDTVAIGVWDSANGGTIRIYSVETGEELDRLFAHSTNLSDVVYSPDGSLIVSSSWDNSIRIWDTKRGVAVQNFTGFNERILALDYNSNSDYLLIAMGNFGNNEYKGLGSDHPRNTSLYLWDLRSRDEILTFREQRDWLWAVDMSDDGVLAVTSGGPLRLPVAQEGQTAPSVDTTVRVWNVGSGEIVAELSAHTNTVDSVRFHPDGLRVLSAAWDGQIILWEIATGEEIRRYTGGHQDSDDNPETLPQLYMLRFLGDGSRFVSVGSDGKAVLWDTETGEVIRVYDHAAPAGRAVSVYGVDFSPDGTQIATTTSGDNQVYLWNIESGELIRSYAGHTSGVNEVRFHPTEPYLVSTAWDNTIRVWDIATGEEVRQFVGHTGATFGLDFSSDGSILLSTSGDRTVRMWEWATGEEMHRFNSHIDWVNEVIFSPDNTIAISAGQDPAARVWRIDRSTDQLADFANSSRYIRDLSCDERDLYHLPACED